MDAMTPALIGHALLAIVVASAALGALLARSEATAIKRYAAFGLGLAVASAALGALGVATAELLVGVLATAAILWWAARTGGGPPRPLRPRHAERREHADQQEQDQERGDHRSSEQ
ncbi:hypothetical protein ER308_18805 [Egibacter rhizosphaerae]|uniref:Uncharacterized protein n=1 Tax=Egibacter rhizosphaerae TaxID=1670831 RepID=A0A411YJP1_9ACTN|nr:hypothetical protein [Egibacter rhizosphaerae]QBI21414.1 hypothetical protein ER308_18805 [Egibacter rhizosphaerae]